jgi:hypothetical protein
MLGRAMLMAASNSVVSNLWTPQNISGWVQLFIADSVSVDGSLGVSQLNDLSGNGYHATQSTPANRPIWSATSFGGAAGISGGNFSGQVLAHTAPQPGTALSTFVVATSINLSPDYVVLYCSAPPNAQMRINWYMRYAGVSKVVMAHAANNQTNTNPTLAASTSYVLTATNSAAGTSPSTYNCRTNAVSGATVTNPVYAGDTADRRLIFGEDASAVCQAIIGACGYINRVLSTTELQQLEGWAAWKWNFVANLPAGHPYKSAAPTV